jgi:predicted small lipoprotein YifL
MSERNMHVRIGLAFLAGALLGACGQRGALYLPEEDRNVVVTPAQTPVQAAPTEPASSPADAASPTETDEQRRNSTAPAR